MKLKKILFYAILIALVAFMIMNLPRFLLELQELYQYDRVLFWVGSIVMGISLVTFLCFSIFVKGSDSE